MPTLVSLLPSDLARTRGGAERYAFELHAALREELPAWRARGVVAASADMEQLVPDGWVAAGGSRARRLPSGDAVGARTALHCVLQGADIVVCHQWRTRAATALRLGARLRRGTRLVVVDHGGGTRLGYALSWIPLPSADIGAHQSEFEAEISPTKARSHVVIRGGIDDRRFRPVRDRTASYDFLMVGRFLPYKGQLRFLECLPEGARARLIGPSDSEDPAYLLAVADKAAERGVKIEFDVPDEELVAAYQDARYTVQVPIDFRRYAGAAPPELLGLTMLEAMACGSVPICPATGASAEFVNGGRTGLTYEAGSVESLGATLRGALRDRDGHVRLRDGALSESGRWTWTAAARSLLGALGV